jgi:hypothetical protein
MGKIIFIICFFDYAAFPVSAQSKKNPRNWQIIVTGDHLRKRGFLQKVTDSSVVLLIQNHTDEINFTTIRKIKLKLRYIGVATGVAGFFVEGIAGGVIIGNSLSAGKTGEPAAMSGVVGGIGGGLLVALTAAVMNPVIVDILTSKKFFVEQDSIYFQSLELRLKPYCLIQ